MANGHYHASKIPDTPGLKEWKSTWPNRVQPSKSYRKPHEFKDQVKTPLSSVTYLLSSLIATSDRPLDRGRRLLNRHRKRTVPGRRKNLPVLQGRPIRPPHPALTSNRIPSTRNSVLRTPLSAPTQTRNRRPQGWPHPNRYRPRHRLHRLPFLSSLPPNPAQRLDSRG